MTHTDDGMSEVDWCLLKIRNEFRESIQNRLNRRGLQDLLKPGEEYEFTFEVEVVKRQPGQAEVLTENHLQN